LGSYSFFGAIFSFGVSLAYFSSTSFFGSFFFSSFGLSSTYLGTALGDFFT